MRKGIRFLFIVCFIFFWGCSNSEFDSYGRNKITGGEYNEQGFDVNGYNVRGFDINGIHKDTRTIYDRNGFDTNGFNENGIDKEGYNREGYDKKGYNRKGYNKIDLDKGYLEDFLSFHYAAWFEYSDSPLPDYDYVYGLTYSNNYRDLHYSRFVDGSFKFLDKPPIEFEIKNRRGLRAYRRDIVLKEIDNILSNDNFNKFSNPKDILNRDLKIKKKLDLIWKSKKEYEDDFDLIRRNLDILEQYKKIFDTVVVFKRKASNSELKYDTDREKLIVRPEDLIRLTTSKSSNYIGSNVFGVSTKVNYLETRGNIGELKSFREIEVDLPKQEFIKNNYKLKNFIIEYLVITDEIKNMDYATEATLDSPYSYSMIGMKVIYRVVGIKIKYNNKIIYKDNLLKNW